MNLGKTLNLSSSSGGRPDDTTVITGRLASKTKLRILTDQQPFPKLRRQRRRGQVAKAMDCKSIIRGFESHRRLSWGQKPFFWLQRSCVTPHQCLEPFSSHDVKNRLQRLFQRASGISGVHSQLSHPNIHHSLSKYFCHACDGEREPWIEVEKTLMPLNRF